MSLRTFSDLGLSDLLVSALESQGLTSPFPVQALTIPDILEGHDVCGQAKTGSGKTLAFGLPVVERITRANPKRPRALVLVPTRELALQVSEVVEPYLEAREMRVAALYGGTQLRKNNDRLREGIEMAVATPGRMIDLLDRKSIYLSEVETVVIDEADEMADMGFLPQVHHIMRQVNPDAQVLLFSATLDHRIHSLVRSYLTDPVYHQVTSDSLLVETSQHKFLAVHALDKPKLVARLAANAGRILVFVRTKRNCDRVAADLQELGVSVKPIHGDIPQVKRERAMSQMASGAISVLVATGVAARGIHIEGLDLVVHWDPPEDGRAYLHRSGRTARAGENGLVVTLVAWDQMDAVRRVQKEAGLHEPIIKMLSNDPRLDDLSGWMPEPLAPDPVRPKKSSRRRSRNRLL